MQQCVVARDKTAFQVLVRTLDFEKYNLVFRAIIHFVIVREKEVD